MLVVGPIKAALDKRLGRAVALSSAYHLLHRYHWRQLAPDKRHPQSDSLAQDGRKLPETLTRKNRGQNEAIKLVIQEEACLGRISHVRCCWAAL